MLEISFHHYMQQNFFESVQLLSREKSYAISMETKGISC